MDFYSTDLHDDSEDEDSAPVPRSTQQQSGSTAEAGSNSVPTPVSSTSAGPAGRRGTKRRSTSWVWKFVTINDNYIDTNGVNLGQRAICNICGLVYSSNSKYGTGHIDRHLKTKHLAEISEANGDSDLSNFVYSKANMRKGLALYVAAAEQPFTFVMEEKFKKYFEDMSQLFILGTVMHPKIKLRGVEVLLKSISNNLAIKLPSVSDVKVLLSTIHALYESKYATNDATTASTDPLPSIDINDDPSWSLISTIAGISGNSSSSSEVETYLERDYTTENDNV
ncbi:hypothetical protein Dimus_021586 [Dionaea muscipula]